MQKPSTGAVINLSAASDSVRQERGAFDFTDAKPSNLGPMRASAPTVKTFKLMTMPLREGFLQKGPHLADVVGLGVDELLGEGVYPVVFAFAVMPAPQAFDQAPGIALNHHFGNL